MSVPTGPIRRQVGFTLAAAAAIQAVAAILFYFAANWWGMAPGLKLGLLDLALLVCALAAAWAPAGSFARSAWACAGATVSGVLFGVHGQIWQTGADTWELFALWTAVAALWALLARADAAWLLTAMLGMVALWLWGDDVAPVQWVDVLWQIPLLAAAPLLVLPVAQATANAPARWLMPALLALILVPLTAGGVIAVAATVAPLAVAMVTACLVLLVLRPGRFGPWPLALGLMAAVVSVETLVIHLVVQQVDDGALGLSLAAVLLLAGVAALARVLVVLFGAYSSQARLHLAASAVVAVGAWGAVGVALAAVGWIADMAGIRPVIWAIAALALAMAVVLRLLASRPGLFAHHVGAALAVAAYGSVLVQLVLDGHQAGAAAVAAVVLLAPLALLTRAAAAGAVAALMAVAVVAAYVDKQEPLAVAGLALVLAPLGWLGLTRSSPAVRAAAVCLLLATFLLPAGVEFLDVDLQWPARLAAVVVAGGLLAGAVWLRRALRRPRLLVAAALMLGGALAVPAGGAGLVGLTAASARGGGRLLVALGFGVAGWSLSRFYYLLPVSLDRKAMWLAVGAGVTAVAWRVVAGRRRRWRWPAPAALTILAAAVVPAAIEAWDGAAKARVVAQGRQVLLPLRPADPRSLIQGDFMRLAYGAALMHGLPSTGGMVALRVDEDGVAVAARPLADGAPAADEVVVRVRPGRDRPRLAPTAFLFPEGQGALWARAWFAVVRIHAGTLVLTGLAGVDRVPIDGNQP